MRRNRLFMALFVAMLTIVLVTVPSSNAAAAFFSKSSTDYYKEGFSHFQKRNYYLAIQSLEKALQLKADYPVAQRILAFSYMKTGRALDAEYIFTEQYKKDSANIEVIQGLAWSKQILGKNAEAEKYFQDEFKWSENHVTHSHFSWYDGADQAFIENIYGDANFGLAFLAKAQKNYSLAVKYFETAVKYPRNYPNDFTPRTNILTAYGDLYYDQAKYPEAIAIYERAVKEDKNNLSAQLKIAWSYYFSKDYPAAEKSFEKALSVSKKLESVEALYGIALSNYFQNKFDKAYSNFTKAIAVDPYYMDNAVVQGIIEKKPEWRTLWKNFGLAYAGSNYYAAIYKLDGYLQQIKADDIEVLLAAGWSYRGLGYLDKAMDLFNAVLRLNPKSEEAFVGLGFTYLSYNKPADALNAFKQAISINPQGAIAYNGLAYYYVAQKNDAKALESIQKSVALKGNYYDSQAFLANLFLKQKKYDQAIKEYEKLISIDKSSVYSWNMSGWAYYSAGKYDNAIKAFAESKKINPFLVEASYGLGLSFAKAGEMNDAKDELATAISLYPSYAHTQDLINLIAANPKWNDLYKTLGRSYYNNQQYQLSAAAFKKYLAGEPGDIEGLRGMAWSNYWLGQLDASYAGFKEILNDKAKDTDALVGMGWVLYIRGKDSEALNYLEKAVKIDDSIVNAWRAIAAINFRAKKLKEAGDIYKKITAIQPLAVDAYNNQGWSLYKENKYAEAIAKFNESLRVNPYLGEPYYGLALSYAKLGNIAKAKENFTSAMYLYPSYMDGQELYNVLDGNLQLKELYNSLGWSYYYQYNYDKAKFHFNKILKADAGNRDALLGIGTIAYVLGDWNQAIDSFNKLLPGIASTAATWDKYSYMLDNLGWSYYYTKQYDKALETFRRLEKYHPNAVYIAPLNGEGWCELMKGNKAEAQKLFQKSLKIVPYNYSAEKGMQEINK
ncbi:MAG: hypothetical protein CVU52_03950 [Deltaproteobacteria bacterium HGW-Deltaproteobacteria-10]|nr:MAG: hypothetical protein CVU52_03950 [Deltaproteobacteria bacterium HGW-Deltaproteobacteria-10]